MTEAHTLYSQPVWRVIQDLTEEEVKKLLRRTTLIQEEEELIELVYGITSGKRHTLEQAAKTLNISSFQAEALEKTAAQKLAESWKKLRRCK